MTPAIVLGAVIVGVILGFVVAIAWGIVGLFGRPGGGA